MFTSERGKIPEQTRTEPGAPTQWELSYLRQIPTPAIKPRAGPTVGHTLRLQEKEPTKRNSGRVNVFCKKF